MEPYFQDSGSQFIQLAEALIEASRLEGVPVTVATFNQDGQLPGQHSPATIFAGPYDRDRIAAALHAVDVPRRPNGRYADADFLGALKATIGTLLEGGEGVIWMLSNNKNAPNNDPNVEANTRAFYDLLRSSPYVTRMVAFPLRMPVKGPNFAENGFIVYGIAYGARAAQALDVIVAPDTPLRALFADPPIFLKPLEPQTLELLITPQPVGEGAQMSMQQDVVVIDGLPGGARSTITFTGRVRNVAYPKKILSARLNASWADTDEADGTPVAGSARIGELAAGALSEPMTMTLDLVGPPKPDGFANLFTTDVTVDGYLKIVLQNLTFDLDDGFVAKAAAVFGGEMVGEGHRAFVEQQLPTIFFDFRGVDHTVSRVPLRLVFHYSPLPLYAAGAGLLLGLAGLAAIPLVLLRPRDHLVRVAGAAHRVRLRPGQQVTLTGGDGRAHIVRGRAFGRPSVLS
ncbi:hypothetical protein [Ancylobacter pratisalsi]|uniref:Uncharacterized protein n=1 Tax=Ancylobacter pratisalsi TaxID=1745854 RepID=A0A6P1YPT0_9HYPH|nr:hypothetical protein [Ancylobacter pratisalsi]QIB33724.1 hypothetical protein G3A50_08420 [Ancylobacter pratisalsi]